MKWYTEIEKKFTPKEMAEAFVFPTDLSMKEKEESLNSFNVWRKKNESKTTSKSKLISQLLQLRFQMEDYLTSNEFIEEYDFGYFLKEYITRLEIKNKKFAEDIDIDPTELSQIINRHRLPNEKLIIRLEIHSNKNFPAVFWFKLIEKQRFFNLLNDNKLKQSERKHVKKVLDFVF